MRFIVIFMLACISILLVSCDTSTKQKLGILKKSPDSTKVQTRDKLRIPHHVLPTPTTTPSHDISEDANSEVATPDATQTEQQ